MGLINLVNRLSNKEKSKILGKNTTKIIRYTFVNNDYEALPKEILNKAVALNNGVQLVNSNSFKAQLIEALSLETLKDLGFEGNNDQIYDNAILHYKKNPEHFFNDFDIEDKYRIIEVVDNRNNTEYVTPIYGECNGKNAFPHDYQLILKKKLKSRLLANNNYNTKKILVTMPTGAGKTVLAMEAIVDLFRNHSDDKSLNIAWLVNSKELCEQSLQSFQKLWKQKGDRKIMAQRYFDRFNSLNFEDVDKITFASFQLLTPRVTDKNREDLAFLKNIDYLFIDEAHFTGADQYQEIFKYYSENNDDPKIVGLTATPLRSDDNEFSSLKAMFNSYLQLINTKNEIEKSPINYLIDREYLSKIEYQVINETHIVNSNDNQINSDYYRNLHENVKNTCINLIDKNQNTIIFAESKAHAVALSLFLKNENIQNELIVGDTPNANRKNYLERLSDKNDGLSIIINEKILATGIDVPGLNSIMILSNIKSVTTALQILGRAMRGPNNGGNKNNTIYITKDNKLRLQNYNLLEQEALN